MWTPAWDTRPPTQAELTLATREGPCPSTLGEAWLRPL